jgi:hypothetical protein
VEEDWQRDMTINKAPGSMGGNTGIVYIVEPRLWTADGHEVDHVVYFARALKRYDDSVKVAALIGPPDENLSSLLEGESSIDCSYSTFPKRLMSDTLPLSNLATFALKDALRMRSVIKKGCRATLFFSTWAVYQMLMVAFLRIFMPFTRIQVIGIMRNDPLDKDGNLKGNYVFMSRNPLGRFLADVAFNGMSTYTDSLALKDTLSRQLGIESAICPIPVPGVWSMEEGEIKPPDGRPMTVGFIGQPRGSRGFELFVETALEMEEERRMGKVRFLAVIQPGGDVFWGTGKKSDVLRVGLPGMDLVERWMTAGEFARQMNEVDAVWALGDSAIYRMQTSGIFAHAMCLGKKVITNARGWAQSEGGKSDIVKYVEPTIEESTRAVRELIGKRARPADGRIASIWRLRNSHESFDMWVREAFGEMGQWIVKRGIRPGGESSGKPRVAFIADYTPTDKNGSGVYVLAILRQLIRSGMQLKYIGGNMEVKPWMKYIRKRAASSFIKMMWDCRIIWTIRHHSPSFMGIPYRAYRKIRFGKEDADVQERPVTDAIKKELSIFNPDVVIASYIRMAPIFDVLDPQILKVMITHDVMHERASSMMRYDLLHNDSSLKGLDFETERRMLSKADVIVAIQGREAETFRRMMPEKDVIVLPMPTALQKPQKRQVRGRCLFVGSKAAHNVHGLDWFLGDVWPIILEAEPSASLHVCGLVGTKMSGEHPHVSFMGSVPDLNPEYSQAQVCIIPLLAGSGLKIKLVEALSFARACVATGVGLQGLEDLEGKAVVLADHPVEFASGVLGLIADDKRRKRMESAAHEYVAKHLTPNAACAALIDRIRSHET